MEVDVNFKNRDKHWVLVILEKIQNLILLLIRPFIFFFRWLWVLIQKSWKVLIGIAAIIFMVYACMCGHKYYKYTYVANKLLDEAVDDIKSKFESYAGQEKIDYAYKILQADSRFGYEGVDDYRIRERIRDLYKPAFSYIESQAYAGEAECQYALGRLYFFNNCSYVKKDNQKAAYWWNEAAMQGYVRAYNSIGLCYKRGIGVAKDMNMAVMWLKKGAMAGVAWAQKNYGDLFLEGVRIQVGSHKKLKDGYNPKIYDKYATYAWEDVADYKILIPVDIDQAKYWWKKSAEQGNMAAKDALQKIY